MNNSDLSIQVLSARAVTGRMPTELVEEGVEQSDVWTEDELPWPASFRYRHAVEGHFSETTESWSPDLGELQFASGHAPVKAVQEYEDPEAIATWERLARHLLDHLFATRLRPAFYERLTERLQILMDPDEWDVGDRLPSWQSFLAVLQFLQRNPILDIPFVGLVANGHFELSWRNAEGRMVVLEFRDDGMIDWLLFTPTGRGGRRGESAGGTSPFESVLNRLIAFDALDWIYCVDKQS